MTNCYAHSEVKIRGKWHHHCEFCIPRNIALFSFLGCAGTGSSNSIQTKGTPQELTDLTIASIEEIGSKVHSITWLDKSEINRLRDWCFGNIGAMFFIEVFPSLFGMALCDFDCLHRLELEDVRVVVFFE